MDTLEKLKERLINLEIEQRRQDREVQKLGDLEQEIERLEETLAQIGNTVQKEKEVPSVSLDINRVDLEEIARIEKELADIDKEKPSKPNGNRRPKKRTQSQSPPQTVSPVQDKREVDKIESLFLEEIEKFRTDLKLSKSTTTDDAQQTKSKDTTTGYVIRLMFDTDTPGEWSEESGGGWRAQGAGTCYQDIKQMKQRLRAIKKQWPDYPLKVIKKS